MIENKTDILDAIKEHYGFTTNAEFARHLGVTPQVLSNWYSRNTFDYEVIFNNNEGINADWLFTGKGKMFKKQDDEKTISDQQYIRPEQYDKIHESQAIPLYEVNAAAGLKCLFENEKQNIIDTLRIPNLSKVDGAIFITGDSMYPLLKSGDIVVYKQIYNIEYLHLGDIYILAYEINGDEYVVIKYVNESEKDGHVKLVSYNDHYKPIDIPISAISTIALVKASVRYNTMQ